MPAEKSEQIIRFPLGLLGFEQIKTYQLIANPADAPFMWLQMLDDADQGFLVVSPEHAVPDYHPDINQEDVAFLALESSADAILLNIVTVRGQGRATINLKGPIVVNRHTWVAKQVIPNNAGDLPVHHPLAATA
jgi:flagellar assembly factor FliW